MERLKTRLSNRSAYNRAFLREVQKADPGASVEFAFEVNVIDAKNPAGYSWELIPAVPFEGKHPLADLMAKAAQITAQKQKQIGSAKK